jgi:hypothetical protein
MTTFNYTHKRKVMQLTVYTMPNFSNKNFIFLDFAVKIGLTTKR